MTGQRLSIKADAYYGSSNNVGCSGSDYSACQGICPVGWHVPTGAVGGEILALFDATGGCVTSNDDCWNDASDWEGVRGGSVSPNGALDLPGKGYYWSSTFFNYNNAYDLYFDPTLTTPATGGGAKRRGRAVRCLRNY
jgi:uncharacterized protein (TIGR02145 family)